MAGFQTCMIIGNVGADPEVRHTQAGQSVATFRVAVNESWTDKEGNKQERAEWFRVVAWGKLGEVCGQYLQKGRQVHVVGKMKTREWEDKDGQKRFTTELNADTVTFLGSGSGERSEGYEKKASGGSGGGKRSNPEPDQPPLDDDDIPF